MAEPAKGGLGHTFLRVAAPRCLRGLPLLPHPPGVTDESLYVIEAGVPRSGTLLRRGEMGPRVPHRRRSLVLGKGQRQRNGRFHLMRGQPLLPRREEKRHLESPRQSREVIGHGGADLSRFEEFDQVGVQPCDDADTPRHPALLSAQYFSHGFEREFLFSMEVGGQHGLLVEGDRRPSRVEPEHQGLGLEEVPLPHQDGHLGIPPALEDGQPLEAVHEFEDARRDLHDRYGVLQVERNPPPSRIRTLEISQAGPDLPDEKRLRHHAVSPVVRALARLAESCAHAVFSGRERT
jgi:hypothetical protein